MVSYHPISPNDPFLVMEKTKKNTPLLELQEVRLVLRIRIPGDVQESLSGGPEWMRFL